MCGIFGFVDAATALPPIAQLCRLTNLLGHRFLERDLRLGVETSYRELARWASSSTERIELVDRANEVRPRTWT